MKRSLVCSVGVVLAATALAGCGGRLANLFDFNRTTVQIQGERIPIIVSASAGQSRPKSRLR